MIVSHKRKTCATSTICRSTEEGSTIRIYISGTFTAQARLRAEADALRNEGHGITSDWLYEPAKPASLNTDEWNAMLAAKDIAQVYAADCIILDTIGESTTGGRYVEWGVACAPGAPQLRYTVGGWPGVFGTMAHRHFKDWVDLRAYFFVNHNARNDK